MKLPWTEKQEVKWVVTVWKVFNTSPAKQLRVIDIADRKRLPLGVDELVAFGPFTLREARELRDELQGSILIYDTD